MKHLVIGFGQVGQAMQEALDCDHIDIGQEALQENYDILDICFGYFDGFIKAVDEYRNKYHPKYIVIHSTVPVGTCEFIGANHSPIRGKHPNLYESVKIFKKFIGGPDVKVLVEEYESYGIPTYGVSRARDTEAMKLWDTTQYGNMILLEKEIHKYCEDNDVDFEVVYSEANRTYNEGYEMMDMEFVRRPVLKHQDGKIGGHCVIPNCKLLDADMARHILEVDDKL